MLNEKFNATKDFVEEHESELVFAGSTVFSVLAFIGCFFVYKKAIASGVRDGILQAAASR